MAVKMVEDAEADGRLQPGGTVNVKVLQVIQEWDFALVAIIKGYKLI
jgi:cystathionine beta-synthase